MISHDVISAAPDTPIFKTVSFSPMATAKFCFPKCQKCVDCGAGIKNSRRKNSGSSKSRPPVAQSALASASRYLFRSSSTSQLSSYYRCDDPSEDVNLNDPKELTKNPHQLAPPTLTTPTTPQHRLKP